LNTRDRKDIHRIFVLDTNVLMHDPAAIFRFEEHDIYIPMIVLEELDAGKTGLSESARNVRQVSRFLDELMHAATKRQIETVARSIEGAETRTRQMARKLKEVEEVSDSKAKRLFNVETDGNDAP